MTKGERVMLLKLAAEADRLLNGEGSKSILNIDVVEALLWDVKRIANGQAPDGVSKLLSE